MRHGRSGHLLVTLLVLVLAYHFRAQILAWLRGVSPSAAALVSPLIVNNNAGANVNNPPSLFQSLIAAFGGGGGDIVIGPNGAVSSPNSLAAGLNGFPGGFTGFGGSGGGTIDYSYLAAGSSAAGTYPDGSKSRCSTHATDGKMLCA